MPAPRRLIDKLGLARLAGRVTDADVRRLNYAVDGDKRDPREVVREFLAGVP